MKIRNNLWVLLLVIAVTLMTCPQLEAQVQYQARNSVIGTSNGSVVVTGTGVTYKPLPYSNRQPNTQSNANVYNNNVYIPNHTDGYQPVKSLHDPVQGKRVYSPIQNDPMYIHASTVMERTRHLDAEIKAGKYISYDRERGVWK